MTSTATAGRSVRIGGACAFVGDSILGPLQLVAVEGMQYLVFDYLAEMTLSSFAQARKVDPEAGYAEDFVQITLREILPACARHGIKLISNAGGLHPQACAAAIERLQQELGTSLRVAYVDGDDCLSLMEELRAEGVQDFYDGSAMPAALASANAYLGALPIAKALELGADIVVTGRIVDSAATLGALMHEFGWAPDEWHRLASGSLAGHLLECGAQATGGIFTDWQQVPGWENIGYPYLDVFEDGSFELSKPEGTGGLVTPATVGEQVLYEVGDPAHYILPDVVCDFTQVSITPCGPDRVRVEGARGQPAPATYKVSASWQSGWRCIVQVSVFGMDAVAKARRTGEALLARTRSMLRARGLSDFEKSNITVLGAEDGYGPHARQYPLREAVVRVAVVHQERQALEMFSREARSAGVSFAPGTTAGSALNLNARSQAEPRYRLFSCLAVKERCASPRVVIGGQQVLVQLPRVQEAAPAVPREAPSIETPQDVELSVPTALVRLAHGRSGDKGDTNNVAILARRPDFLPLLRQVLTPARVAAHLGHLLTGQVVRYEVPGLHALNFVLNGSLDGGGPTSLRPDPMGKGMAQMLLEMEVPVPVRYVAALKEMEQRQEPEPRTGIPA